MYNGIPRPLPLPRPRPRNEAEETDELFGPIPQNRRLSFMEKDWTQWPCRVKASVAFLLLVAVFLIVAGTVFLSFRLSLLKLLFSGGDSGSEDKPFIPVTMRPLPANYNKTTAINVLKEMGLDPQFKEEDCDSGHQHSPTYKNSVTIQNHTWFGEAASKKNAKTMAARNAMLSMFNITFTTPQIDPPKYPCI